MVVCERELETEQNYIILTPTLLAITAFISRSPVLLNRRPGGPLCWVLVFSTASFLQLVWPTTADFLSSPGLYNNLTPTLLPASVTISHSFNPSTVKVIISWYSSTGCTCYLHWCISYFDSLAGSEVNVQQSFSPRTTIWRLTVIADIWF